MRYSPHYRWLIILGVLPILSCFGLENKASASCGDYVQILNEKSQTPVDQHQPCHGPNCQQQSPVPPIPLPAPPSTQQTPTDVILISCPEVVPQLTSESFEPEPGFSCRGAIDSIFHPPR